MSTPSTTPILVFSLGPVQGFVAQSRRTADGWLGSYLLSYLAGHAIRTVEQHGATVREPFPGDVPMYQFIKNGTTDGDTTLAALGNVLVVECGNGLDPDTLGHQAAETVQATWADLVSEVEAACAPVLAKAPVRRIWERQTGVAAALAAAAGEPSFWELYWGWGDSAATAFEALAGRKGLRDFTQHEEAGDRCTLCGEREALWNAEDHQQSKEMRRDAAKRQWRGWVTALNAANKRFPAALLRPEGHERLCAICLIKRLLPWCDNGVTRAWRAATPAKDHPEVFPSTSTVATALYRVRLLDEAAQNADLQKALRGYRSTLLSGRCSSYRARRERRPRYHARRMNPRTQFVSWPPVIEGRPNSLRRLLDWALRIDGDWYLYGPAVKNERGFDEPRHDAIVKSHDALLHAARSAGLKPPPRYYALLVMDGDSMGDFKRAVEDAGIDTGTVSRWLARFAAEADLQVRACDGRTVYCGGDDVLALLPLERALAMAETLRCSYATFVAEWKSKYVSDNAAETLRETSTSLSGALVLAHHQAPLGRVIATGQQLLKGLAKKRAGRNALAIGIFRRGGLDRAFAAPWEWQWENATHTLADDLGDLVATLADDRQRELSTSIGHRLRDEAWVLAPGKPLGDTDSRVRYLAARLEKSRLEPADNSDGAGERARRLARSLLALCDNAVTHTKAPDLVLEPLLIARFLAGGGRRED